MQLSELKTMTIKMSKIEMLGYFKNIKFVDIYGGL